MEHAILKSCSSLTKRERERLSLGFLLNLFVFHLTSIQACATTKMLEMQNFLFEEIAKFEVND